MIGEKNDIDILTDLHVLIPHEYENMVWNTADVRLTTKMDAFFLFGNEELILS